MIAELAQYDAVSLGELTRKGKISPVELLDATIQQIEEFNPRLNAVSRNSPGIELRASS